MDLHIDTIFFSIGVMIGKYNSGKIFFLSKPQRQKTNTFFFLPDVFIPMPENLLVNLNENKEVRTALHNW